MDFLDSLDLDVSNKRSHRVRSWYLYEQYKSLERNQLDATQKLKDRSYQDRILRQELSERKARRNLYEYGLCQSESRIERRVKSEGARTALSVTTDDFFESFCELHDGRLTHATDNIISESSSHERLYEDDFKSVDEHKDDTSYAETVNSVVNIKSDETITEDLEKELDYEEPTVVDEINLYFDEVKDNLERIEKLTELDVDDKTLAKDSLYSIEEKDALPVVMKDKTVNTSENNVFTMWSKLVSFAHQIIQLNQGNCYVDYGSQFLTAVLACDVLRRGINRMCHILQPYVCPIKFATDDSDSSTDSHKSVRRKSRSNRYTCTDRTKTNVTKHQITRKYRSENCWQHFSGYPKGSRITQHRGRRASEPWRSTSKFSLKQCNPSFPSKSSYSSEWPDFSNDDSTEYFLRDGCKCRYKVLNPMLKLSQYFDSVLKDIDDSMVV